MSNDSRKPKGSPGGTGGEYDRKRTGTAGLPPLTGRVDTLVPPLRLSDERKGKAPELRPGERPESAQGRFGRYLGANLEGDRAGAELDALRVLYGPQVSPLDLDDPDGCDLGAAAETRRYKGTADELAAMRLRDARADAARTAERTGGPVRAYWDGKRQRLIEVSDGRRVASRVMPEAMFRHSGLRIASLHLPDVLAASQVLPEMDMNEAGMERDRARDAMLSRDSSYDTVRELAGRGYEEYRRAAGKVMGENAAEAANLTYRKRNAGKGSADVYQDKKHRDPEHDRAGRESTFARDFGRIEVDDDVDLDRFRMLGDEYRGYASRLPAQRIRADLRFRYTGRHRATGTYHPSLHNIAVDPRHPSSFTHEYFHHLDHTSDPSGTPLSQDPRWLDITRRYAEAVDPSNFTPATADRWTAPTEVLARAGEMWMNRKTGDSSFTEPAETYATRWDYAPLNAMRDEVFAFLDDRFGA